jgi:CBS domain containing-hemolysin-like protein
VFALAIFVAVAVGVSFFCSLLEAALLTMTPAYVHVFRQQRPKIGARLVELQENIDRPLAAILSLNTVAHTVGAAGAGAQAASVFGSAWVGVFSAALTLAILVLSEIIPKTLGVVHWRRLTPFVALTLPWLIWLTLPLVWLSAWLTRRLRKENSKRVVRKEIEAIAEIGQIDGALDADEAELLKRLLKFRDVLVGDVMTPIEVVASLREDNPITDARALPFSRIPVYRDQATELTGYVLKSELQAEHPDHEPPSNVGAFRREILDISELSPLSDAIERLVKLRQHIAAVTLPGEPDVVVGIVTLEDVIETLLGVEIVDEFDPAIDMRDVARRQAAARRSWE